MHFVFLLGVNVEESLFGTIESDLARFHLAEDGTLRTLPQLSQDVTHLLVHALLLQLYDLSWRFVVSVATTDLLAGLLVDLPEGAVLAALGAQPLRYTLAIFQDLGHVGTSVTDRAIGLDDRLLVAMVAPGLGSQRLILPVVDLPLDDVVASPAEAVQRGIHDLLCLDRVLVVLELERVLILLRTLLLT